MNFFNIFKNELMVLGLSMLPISEIRGAIIYASATLNDSVFNLFEMYILAVIGNFIPVPFIIMVFRPILNWLKRTKLLRSFAHWLEERTKRKASKISKISIGALYIFVAVPFPTTGAWTGAMIASLLNMRYKYAFPAVLLGIITSGLIMVLLCTGILNLGVLNEIFLK